MASDELRRDLHRAMDGELPEPARERLEQLLAADPALGEERRRLDRLTSAVRASRPQTPVGLEGRILARVQEGAAAGAIAAERAASRFSARGSRAARVSAALAASLLLLAFGWQLSLRPGEAHADPAPSVDGVGYRPSAELDRVLERVRAMPDAERLGRQGAEFSERAGEGGPGGVVPVGEFLHRLSSETPESSPEARDQEPR